MKFGTHFAAVMMGDPSFNPYPAIDKTKKLGYEALEISFGDVMEQTEDEAMRIADYANKMGVKLVLSGMLPEDCDMLSDDIKVREDGIRYWHRMLPLMQKMDIDMVVGCLFTKWPTRRTIPITIEEREELIRRTIEVYREAAAPAVECGVTCAQESLNRFEAFLCNCSDETAAFVDAVGNPNVKMHFDTFHMNIEEDSITGAIETAGDRLAALHVAERNRRFPGMGDFGWDDYFKALKKINFDGYMNLEVFMNAGNELSADIGVWRDISRGVAKEEYDKLHADALIFLKGKAKQHGLI